jgi:hypothetical protein
MYQAELKGKLPEETEKMEDILTSNVFSFFKYSNRIIFLKNNLLEINSSEDIRQKIITPGLDLFRQI